MNSSPPYDGRSFPLDRGPTRLDVMAHHQYAPSAAAHGAYEMWTSPPSYPPQPPQSSQPPQSLQRPQPTQTLQSTQSPQPLQLQHPLQLAQLPSPGPVAQWLPGLMDSEYQTSPRIQTTPQEAMYGTSPYDQHYQVAQPLQVEQEQQLDRWHHPQFYSLAPTQVSQGGAQSLPSQPSPPHESKRAPVTVETPPSRRLTCRQHHAHPWILDICEVFQTTQLDRALQLVQNDECAECHARHLLSDLRPILSWVWFHKRPEPTTPSKDSACRAAVRADVAVRGGPGGGPGGDAGADTDAGDDGDGDGDADSAGPPHSKYRSRRYISRNGLPFRIKGAGRVILGMLEYPQDPTMLRGVQFGQLTTHEKVHSMRIGLGRFVCELCLPLTRRNKVDYNAGGLRDLIAYKIDRGPRCADCNGPESCSADNAAHFEIVERLDADAYGGAKVGANGGTNIRYRSDDDDDDDDDDDVDDDDDDGLNLATERISEIVFAIKLGKVTVARARTALDSRAELICLVCRKKRSLEKCARRRFEYSDTQLSTPTRAVLHHLALIVLSASSASCSVPAAVRHLIERETPEKLRLDLQRTPSAATARAPVDGARSVGSSVPPALLMPSRWCQHRRRCDEAQMHADMKNVAIVDVDATATKATRRTQPYHHPGDRHHHHHRRPARATRAQTLVPDGSPSSDYAPTRRSLPSPSSPSPHPPASRYFRTVRPSGRGRGGANRTQGHTMPKPVNPVQSRMLDDSFNTAMMVIRSIGLDKYRDSCREMYEKLVAAGYSFA